MSRDSRREQLLDIAERLFIARGYSAVSMEDIARAADVSRPIVYSHFETREGAFIACVRRAHHDYLVTLRERVDAGDPPVAQLVAAADMFFGLLEQQPGRWNLIFASSAVLPIDYRAELSALRFETVSLIHQQIKAAAPAAPEPDAEAFAHAISGVGERLGLWWVTRPDLTRAQIVDLYVRVLSDGMRPFVSEG